MSNNENFHQRNLRRVLQGTVLSTKMAKTIVVRVQRQFAHPKYGKFVLEHTKYHAHDENSEARAGDRVDIIATRPISKSKRWRLLRVVETSALAGAHRTHAERGNEDLSGELAGGEDLNGSGAGSAGSAGGEA